MLPEFLCVDDSRLLHFRKVRSWHGRQGDRRLPSTDRWERSVQCVYTDSMLVRIKCPAGKLVEKSINLSFETMDLRLQTLDAFASLLQFNASTAFGCHDAVCLACKRLFP